MKIKRLAVVRVFFDHGRNLSSNINQKALTGAAKPLPSGRPHSTPANLETAILRTVTYADLFNYPLTAVQVHRYLERIPASPEIVAAVLANGRLVPHQLHRQNGYFMLPDRQEIAALRPEREQITQRLWPKAVRYGRILARLRRQRKPA